jgi:hypothetical protein
MMERIKRMTIIHLLQAKRIEAEDDGEDEEGSGARLTIVHLLQVKRREAEDDGEDEEASG